MYSQIVGEVPHGQNRGDIRQISSHGFPPYSFDAEFSQKFQKLTIFCLLYFGPEISTTPSCLSLHARQFLPTGGKARREHFAAHLPARFNALSGQVYGVTSEALVHPVHGPQQRLLLWSILRLK